MAGIPIFTGMSSDKLLDGKGGCSQQMRQLGVQMASLWPDGSGCSLQPTSA